MISSLQNCSIKLFYRLENFFFLILFSVRYEFFFSPPPPTKERCRLSPICYFFLRISFLINIIFLFYEYHFSNYFIVTRAVFKKAGTIRNTKRGGGGGSKREEKKRESENQRYMNVVLGVILKWGYWLVGGHKIKPDHGQFQCWLLRNRQACQLMNGSKGDLHICTVEQ